MNCNLRDSNLRGTNFFKCAYKYLFIRLADLQYDFNQGLYRLGVYSKHFIAAICQKRCVSCYWSIKFGILVSDLECCFLFRFIGIVFHRSWRRFHAPRMEH